MKSKFDVISLTTWVKAEIDKQKGLIDKIISARNQVYAHKDPVANVSQIKLSEIRELVDLASNIFNTINFKFFFSQTYLKMLDSWSIDYVLWYMNEVRALDEERRTSRINKIK